MDMDEGLGALMAIPDALEGVAYLYSLCCLLINAYTAVLPNQMVKVACWIMVVIFVWEVIKIVISFFGDDGFGFLGWVSLIAIAVSLLCAICFFIFKSKIITLLQITQEISTFEWVSLSLVVFYGVSQVVNLIPDIIASFTDAD